MNVDEIVSRVTREYRTARSYSDRGTVTSSFERVGPVIAEFETSFTRGGRFYFSFREETFKGFVRSYRIERDGSFLRMGDPDWRSGRPESLASAVATFTGVTWGSAHVIPRLLLPEEIPGRGLFDEPVLGLGKVEELDGEPHAIVEVGDGERQARIWIHSRSARIRRVASDRHVTDYFARIATTSFS